MGEITLHIIVENRLMAVEFAVTDQVLKQTIIGRAGMDLIIPGWYDRWFGKTDRQSHVEYNGQEQQLQVLNK